MTKQKKPTHWLVIIPSDEGNYKDEDGNRVDIHKFDLDLKVQTKHKKVKGTTIKSFIKNSTYTKN